LDSLGLQGLRRTGAHATAQHDFAIVQQFKNIGMAVRPVLMAALVIAESLCVGRVVVGPELPVAYFCAFEFEDDESLALAEMLRHRYTVDGCDCDLHNSSCQVRIDNSAYGCNIHLDVKYSKPKFARRRRKFGGDSDA